MLNKFLKYGKIFKVLAPPHPTHLNTQTRYEDSIAGFPHLRNMPYNTAIKVINDRNSVHLPVIVTLDTGAKLFASAQCQITTWFDYAYRLQHATLLIMKTNTIDVKETAFEWFTNTITNALDNSNPTF
ncbi:hypothetical protein CEXT_409641 [Caerostris extrusa]|uniref:Uncharacterized protein n=1 Tax=Caerostris extrusa TaxID=172846 RepID=A0AAV4RQU4_CAEEX|nr:hypothetical protein CEXT_409641 [Caerostris extrusa]